MINSFKIILILVLILINTSITYGETKQLTNKVSNDEISTIDNEVAIQKEKALKEAVDMIKNGKEFVSNGKFDDAETEFNNAIAKIKTIGGDIAELKLKQLMSYLDSFRIKWELSLMNEAYAAFGKKNYDLAVIKAREAQSIDKLPEKRKEDIQNFVDLCQKRLDSLVYKEKTSLTYKDVDPDNKIRKYDIDVAMRNADILIKNKQYARARDALEKILIKDPYNFKATDKLKRIYKILTNIGNIRKRSDLIERVTEVQWKWNQPVLPVPAPKPGSEETIKDKSSSLAEKLSNLVIPLMKFENADIQGIVKFLKQESKRIDTVDGTGINIALGLDDAALAAVPRIDIELENIPMNEAIRYVCQKTKLKYKIDEQVLTIGNDSIDEMDTRFFKVRSAIITRIAPEVADQPEEELGASEDFYSSDETFDADKTKSSKRSVTSQAILNYFNDRGVPFPEGSTIAYSKRSGKLTVRNTHDNLRRLETLLRELDIQQPQVLIESKFLEINETDLEEMGFEWWLQSLPRNASDPYEWKINNNSGINRNNTLVRPIYQNQDGVASPVSDLQNSDKLLNNFVFPVFNGISSKIPKLELHMILHALDQNDNTEVLSAPKVIAKNGEEANIRMVREEYYPSTYSTPELVIINGLFQYTPPVPEFAEATDVGIGLTVTPNVSPDNHTITLNLNPQVLQLTNWSDYNISYRIGQNKGYSIVKMAQISRRDIIVSVKTYDGETLVIGGMLKEESASNDDSFPGTDKVPLLGFLGRVQVKSKEKKNLLIFVTARIVNPDGLPIRTSPSDGRFDFRR